MSPCSPSVYYLSIFSVSFLVSLCLLSLYFLSVSSLSIRSFFVLYLSLYILSSSCLSILFLPIFSRYSIYIISLSFVSILSLYIISLSFSISVPLSPSHQRPPSPLSGLLQRPPGSKIYQAVAKYSQAIDLHPTAIYLSNRAFCYVKLEQFGLAIADADLALT